MLNQSTHSRVASSMASKLRHGPRRWITSALNKPLTVSARALSYESLTLPTDGSMPASASRSVYLIETDAPVAMMDEPGAPHRTTLMQGLLQRIEHETGVSRA